MSNRGMFGLPGTKPFGLLADRPAAVGSGRVYFASDAYGGTTYVDTAPGVWSQAGDSIVPATAGPSYGIAPQNFRKWRQKLSTVRTGTGSAKILCIGDSITFGEGATGGTNPVYTHSWPKRLSDLMDAYYIPTVPGLATGSTGVPVADTRFSYGSGWAAATPNFGFGQRLTQGTGGAAGNLVYTPGYAWDTIDIYHTAQTGQWANCTGQATGGASTTIDSSGAIATKKTTLTAGSLSAANTLTLSAPTAGSAFGYFGLIALDAYDSAARKVRIGNAGQSGSTTADWNQAATVPARSLGAIAAYAPDLSIINLGVNDSATTQPTQVLGNIRAIAAACALTGDVILSSTVPNGQTTARPVLQAQYNVLMKDLAATSGYGYVDLFARWESYAIASGAGYMQDTIHPSAAGYADIGQMFFNVLRTI